MKKINLAILACASLFAAAACTNLDEEIYSQVPRDKFLEDDDNIPLYTARPYTLLQKWGREQSMWTLILQVTDELAVPKSYYGEWAGSRYRELHSQKIPAGNGLVKYGWDFCFNGIAACNDAIDVLDTPDKSDARKRNMAEIKTLRAFYYLLAVDCWGNVPYSVNKKQTGYPQQKNRKEMLAWIEQELNENIQYLVPAPSAMTYGRVTKDVAKFLLAKIYMNSEVWTGTARWDKAETICKEIMDSKNYKLAEEYADNFRIDNDLYASEAILAIPHSSVYTVEAFYPYVYALNKDLAKLYNVGETWDGTHMGQPDFMETYEAGDKRMAATWLFGPLSYPDGKPYEIDGKQVSLTWNTADIPAEKFVNGLGRFDGARLIKWPYQSDGSLTNYLVSQENDFFIMRYTDVVLMYVEALLRQDKDASEVGDFKTIRTRAGLTPMTKAQLNLDSFFLERKHEMACEGWTRQDLIRFGKYTRAWWAKDATDSHVELFPIPSEILGANPNLRQNSGY